MKKILAPVLAVILILTMLSGCLVAKGVPYKLGMSVVLSYSDKQTGSISADANVAAVVLDETGKIAACRIDVVSSKVDVTDGFLGNGTAGLVFTSKYDLGDNYNMKTYGGAIAEWYEQADSFAKYCVGKTAEEVKNIAVDGGGKPTDADLLAGCTIGVDGYIDAVVKACEDAHAVSFDAKDDIKLGLLAKGKVDSANDSEANDGSVKLLLSFAATVTDTEGLLEAAIIDAAQPAFKYDDSGAMTEASYGGTKRELGDNYGMVAYAGAVAEWYEQAEHLCDWLIGLSAEDIKAVPDESGKAENADLAASCTINISGDIANIVTAMSKAK